MKLIKFSAKWCPPCQAMKKAKTVEKLAEKYGLALEVHDTDSTTGRPLSDDMKVEIVPTVLLMGPRGKELARHEGPASLVMLERQFKKHLPEV